MPDERPRSDSPSIPVALAMILCDRPDGPVARDPGLRGSFETLAAGAFPLTYPGLRVHLVLTRGEGVVPLRLRLVDGDRRPLFDIPAPAARVDRFVNLGRSPLGRPGRVAVKMILARDLAGHDRFSQPAGIVMRGPIAFG